MTCEQQPEAGAVAVARLKEVADPIDDLVITHLGEIRPLGTQLGDVLLVFVHLGQCRRREQHQEGFADALLGVGAGVVGMRFVRRNARLLPEEGPVNGVDIDTGSAGSEDTPDCGVEIGVAAEDAQEDAVVGVELVVVERAHLHIRIAESPLGHANAVVVLEREVEGAHPHRIGEHLAHVGARPDGIALRRLGADEVAAAPVCQIRHVPSRRC